MISDDNEITFVITSCGRFDLLRAALVSFFEHNTAPIAKYLLIEDSGKTEVRDVLAEFDMPFDVIVNQPPMGQVHSIDRAYSTVETPYIFHCEDDWEFIRSRFIEESLAILEGDPSVSTVMGRGLKDPEKPVERLEGWSYRKARGVGYYKPDVWLDRHWSGYAFCPGLRRLSDYRLIGRFARWGHEKDASIFFKRHGMTVAMSEQPFYRTIGRDGGIAKQSSEKSLRYYWQRIDAEWRFRLLGPRNTKN